METTWRYRPPLPRCFIRHSCFFVVALAVFFALASVNDLAADWAKALAGLAGISAWIIVALYVGYYVIAYPILHAAKRYEGRHQTAWLVWLALETAGLGFGLVRLAYLFNVILPDVRRTNAASA